MRYFGLLFAFLISATQTAFADRNSDLDALAEALQLDVMVEILADEGLEYGADLAVDLFDGRSLSDWQRSLKAIYEPSNMADEFRTHFDPLVSDQVVSEALAFFSSPLGQKVVRLEMTARRAISDADVQAASEDQLQTMIAKQDPILPRLREYIKVNDLIDMNVTGSMNESLAFLTALNQSGALPSDMSEAEIVSSVWKDEDQIREDTTQWLMSYLALSYAPLSQDELTEIIEFSRTEEGTVLNQALFQAFNEVYINISRKMGKSASRFMLSEDI